MDIIRIRPAVALRRDFAAWAVVQRPKVRTCGPEAFAVPAPLYVQMPEALLLGATVDGQSYVPVADTVDTPELPQAEPKSEAPGLPAAPTSDVLLGVATAAGFAEERTAVPGEILPAPGEGDEPTEQPDGVFPCDGCDRQFASKRGLRAHRRQAHGEGAPDAG